jgi:hypothetical protein
MRRFPLKLPLGGHAGEIIIAILEGIIKTDTQCSRFYLRELKPVITLIILARIQAQLSRPDGGIYQREEEC